VRRPVEEDAGTLAPLEYVRREPDSELDVGEPPTALAESGLQPLPTVPLVPEGGSFGSPISLWGDLDGVELFSPGFFGPPQEGVDVAVEASPTVESVGTTAHLVGTSVSTETDSLLYQEVGTDASERTGNMPLPVQLPLEDICRLILTLPRRSEAGLIHHLVNVMVLPAVVGPDRASVEIVVRSILQYERMLFGQLRRLVAETRVVDPSGQTMVQECAKYLDQFRRPT